MAIDIAAFQTNIYRRLAAMFLHSSTSAVGESALFIGYEPIGIPLPPHLFRLNPADALSPDLAREQLSDLANDTPDVNAGVYRRTSKSIDDTYKLILGASAEQVSVIARTRFDANQKFLTVVRTYISPDHDPTATYHPVTASPTNWYDPMVNDNWQRVTFSDSDPPQPTVPNLLRFLPVDFSVKMIDGVADPQIWKWMVLKPEELLLQNHLLNTTWITDHPAVSLPMSSLSIEFELCLVRLGYEWLNWSVFDLPGWYAAGFRAHAKELSIPAIPIASMIARKTSITAILDSTATVNNSSDLENMSSFGPFQLDPSQSNISPMVAGGFLVTKRQENPQLIGWICQVVSPVPPESDPNLPPLQGNSGTHLDSVQQILERMLEANLGNSVGDSTLMEWMSDDDSYYRKLAQGCLEIIGTKRLTARGADLDKVNFFYLQELGLSDEAQLEPNHSVNISALGKALLLAHNNKNSGSSNSLSDILQ